MKLKTLARLAAVIILPVLLVRPAAPADSYIVQIKTDSQDALKIKLKDNGDGTYSFYQVPMIPGLIGKSYKLYAQLFTSTGAMTQSGVGISWCVEAYGGQGQFNVNGASAVYTFDSPKCGDFQGLVSTPTVNVTQLDSGATVQVLLEMAQ